MEWIDVNDVIPPDGSEYLVRIETKEYNYRIRVYHKVIEIFSGMWVLENDDEDAKVTHWSFIDNIETE